MIALPQTPLDRWLPKLVLCLRQYNLRFLTADVIAGLTVGLVGVAAGDGLRNLLPGLRRRPVSIRQLLAGF